MIKLDKLIPGLTLSDSSTFHNKTKINDFEKFNSVSPSKWPEGWKRIYYKSYPRLNNIKLLLPTDLNYNLFEALIKRQSIREFTKEKLSFQNLSNILYYSAGLKPEDIKNEKAKRFYPSAGGRYPLEIYPFIFNVSDLDNGIYHYHLKTHSLEVLLENPIIKKTLVNFEQSWIRKASVLLVVTAVFGRTENKYGIRGYRHVLTEYGHLAQNVYLTSGAMNIACCSIGGFNDDGLNKLLDVDFVDESVVGVIALGTI